MTSLLTFLKKILSVLKPRTTIISTPSVKPSADSTQYSITPWIDWMRSHIGEQEISGTSKNNPFIVAMFKHTDYQATTDETAWCAACVCTALEESGYKSSHNASAISFKDYGMASPLVHGCICVFQWDSGEHHVSFYDEDSVMGFGKFLGGNQSNALQISTYLKKYIIATRWPVK